MPPRTDSGGRKRKRPVASPPSRTDSGGAGGKGTNKRRGRRVDKIMLAELYAILYHRVPQPIQEATLSKEFSDKELRVLMKHNGMLINDYDQKTGSYNEKTKTSKCKILVASFPTMIVPTIGPNGATGVESMHRLAPHKNALKKKPRANGTGRGINGAKRGGRSKGAQDEGGALSGRQYTSNVTGRLPRGGARQSFSEPGEEGEDEDEEGDEEEDEDDSEEDEDEEDEGEANSAYEEQTAVGQPYNAAYNENEADFSDLAVVGTVAAGTSVAHGGRPHDPFASRPNVIGLNKLAFNLDEDPALSPKNATDPDSPLFPSANVDDLSSIPLDDNMGMHTGPMTDPEPWKLFQPVTFGGATAEGDSLLKMMSNKVSNTVKKGVDTLRAIASPIASQGQSYDPFAQPPPPKQSISQSAPPVQPVAPSAWWQRVSPTAALGLAKQSIMGGSAEFSVPPLPPVRAQGSRVAAPPTVAAGKKVKSSAAAVSAAAERALMHSMQGVGMPLMPGMHLAAGVAAPNQGGVQGGGRAQMTQQAKALADAQARARAQTEKAVADAQARQAMGPPNPSPSPRLAFGANAMDVPSSNWWTRFSPRSADAAAGANGGGWWGFSPRYAQAPGMGGWFGTSPTAADAQGAWANPFGN